MNSKFDIEEFVLYKEKYLFQLCSLSGGKIPVNNSHSVIESPEFVNLVNPPTIIIKKTKINEILTNIQTMNLFFSLLETLTVIYI